MVSTEGERCYLLHSLMVEPKLQSLYVAMPAEHSQVTCRWCGVNKCGGSVVSVRRVIDVPRFMTVG